MKLFPLASLLKLDIYLSTETLFRKFKIRSKDSMKMPGAVSFFNRLENIQAVFY